MFKQRLSEERGYTHAWEKWWWGCTQEEALESETVWELEGDFASMAPVGMQSEGRMGWWLYKEIEG